MQVLTITFSSILTDSFLACACLKVGKSGGCVNPPLGSAQPAHFFIQQHCLNVCSGPGPSPLPSIRPSVHPSLRPSLRPSHQEIFIELCITCCLRLLRYNSEQDMGLALIGTYRVLERREINQIIPLGM